MWLALVGSPYAMHFEKLVKFHIARSASTLMINIKNFLLAMDGEGMRFWMDAAGPGSALHKQQEQKDTKWEAKHKTLFEAEHFKPPTTAVLEAFIRANATESEFQSKMFLAMPRREQECVYFEYLKGSSARPRTIPLSRDVAPGLDRMGRMMDKVSCLTGHSEHWLFELSSGRVSFPLWRLLLGEEQMALQGLTLHHCPGMRASSHRDSFLKNLAGNAFNLPCFTLITFCAWTQ